jgi:hypothetical protein
MNPGTADTGVTALWSRYRVFWLFYAATALSSVGYTGISLSAIPSSPDATTSR